MSEREKLSVHLTANDLFYYFDNKTPKRLNRDWLFEPSILLLPEELIVDKQVITQERKFKDENVTSKIICDMVKDKILKPKNFRKYFSSERINEINTQVDEWEIRTNRKRTGIARDGTDILFKHEKQKFTIMNPLCAEAIWEETGFPPIDANWRQSHYYYIWKFNTGIQDTERVLSRVQAFNILKEEFREIVHPENKILGTYPIFLPRLELLPDLNNKEYKHVLKKSPSKWEDFVWNKTEENYGKLKDALKHNQIDSLREFCQVFSKMLIEDERKAKKELRKNLKEIYDEYSKPWGSENMPVQWRCLWNFSYSSPFIAIMLYVVWQNPMISSIGISQLIPTIITKIHKIRYRRKWASSPNPGYFFWLYDNYSLSKVDNLHTLLEIAKNGMKTFTL
ncbi:hypothetical protein ACFLRN_02750 [Thermoproteota archaeon]